MQVAIAKNLETKEILELDDITFQFVLWLNENNYTELDKEIQNGNKNIALLKGTHNMVTYSSYFEEEESVISSKQHLLLVFCLNSTMCKFETSFYS